MVSEESDAKAENAPEFSKSSLNTPSANDPEAAEIQGEHLTFQGSRVEHAQGDQVNLVESHVNLVTSQSANLRLCAVRRLRTDEVEIQHSTINYLHSEREAYFYETPVLLARASYAQFNHSRLVFFFGQATGECKPTFNSRGAAILGLGIGVSLAVTLRLFKKIRF